MTFRESNAVRPGDQPGRCSRRPEPTPEKLLDVHEAAAMLGLKWSIDATV
jgi:hypothetical protein